MNVHHDRALAGKLICVRHIQEAGNRLAVKRLPLDELRLGERCGIQAAGFAGRPAFKFVCGHVNGINVSSGPGAGEYKSQVTAVLVKIQPADQAGGNAGHRAIFARGRVHQIKLADAIFIGDECQRFSIFTEIDFIHVPLDVRGEICGLHGSQVKIGQALEFGITIRCGVEAFAIFAERAAAVSNFDAFCFWASAVFFSPVATSTSQR